MWKSVCVFVPEDCLLVSTLLRPGDGDTDTVDGTGLVAVRDALMCTTTQVPEY